MSDESTKPDDHEQREYRRRAKEHTFAGAAFGVASASAFAVFGTLACPLCAVAAPVLLGSGAYNARRAKQCQDDEAENAQDCCDNEQCPPYPQLSTGH